MKKRTEMQGFRTSKETKAELVGVATHYGLLPGPFVACLVERFVEAHGKNKRMAWPPEFISFNSLLDESFYQSKKQLEKAVGKSDLIDLGNLSEADISTLKSKQSENG